MQSGFFWGDGILYFVYILRCEDDSLYVGITTDVIRRFREHTSCSGLGAKYTRSHKPVCIEAVWITDNRSDASRLEYFLKKLSRKSKDEVIADPGILIKKYSDKLQDINFAFEKDRLKLFQKST